MLSDIEIAQSAEMFPISKIAEKVGLSEENIEYYGKYKAKVDYNILKNNTSPDAKLILVTAINPTPAGEGKTTVAIGLSDGLNRIGKKAIMSKDKETLKEVELLTNHYQTIISLIHNHSYATILSKGSELGVAKKRP